MCNDRILRNIPFDPREISFALTKNNSLLHRQAFPAWAPCLAFSVYPLGPVSAQLSGYLSGLLTCPRRVSPF